ncbi:MAG: sulfurtransferase TusA family protein [Thermodesulfobacteriaceae bacterium]|nr:sulfurtransferase TusA family protein [Thermodesulfobacteriaceae bacterium]MCX8040887.1 sulfurtransferase TusA family protein [Thermodesulfobacteriaceae bacterium]MDW8135224.1 sulfurtransferase TusA family protein [Thermodesulfobacterium sp.]
MKEIKIGKIKENYYQIDMRGWMCPYPKYAIENLLEKLPPQSYMDLLVDCPAATQDVPEVVRKKGFRVEKVVLINDGEWSITIKNF